MRFCACGCGGALPADASERRRYLAPAHRAKAARDRDGSRWVKGASVLPGAHSTQTRGRKRPSGKGVRLYVGDIDDAQRAAAMLPFLASTMSLPENKRALRALAEALERSLARRHSGK